MAFTAVPLRFLRVLGLGIASGKREMKSLVSICNKSGALRSLLNGFSEVVFYNPDSSGNLVRTARFVDTEPDISHCRHHVLNQGRIERFLIDCMRDDGGLFRFPLD